MKDFFNQAWVKITAYVCIILGCIVLILGGTDVAVIAKVPTLVAGILTAIGLLIVFIKDQIKSKDNAGK